MALLSGVNPTFATGAGPGPGPGPIGHYLPPPPHVIDRFGGRRENTDHYYHVVKKQHPLQDKLNQIKYLLQEKFHKKHNRGGHYEHSGHEKAKDYSAAISALTLLSFLFFLYILQSCIRDHMNQMAATAATTTTTTAAPVVVFRERESQRENRQSANFDSVSKKVDRKGESDDYYYEEYPEEISVKLPIKKDAGIRQRSSSALQVYKKPEINFDNYRYMEPVKLIVKP